MASIRKLPPGKYDVRIRFLRETAVAIDTGIDEGQIRPDHHAGVFVETGQHFMCFTPIRTP